jgi:ribosomal protein S18 acetylase RimI-like enzyme
MSTLKIRQASIEDLHELAHLFDQYRQFYEQAPDVALATTFIGDRIKHQQSVVLVAERLVAEDEEKQIVGFCQLYPTFCSVAAAPIAVLYDLFVAQTARKVGAGRALMLAASDYAKQKGFVRLDLSTAKTNVNAQALYESLGWQRDAVFYYYSLETN